MSLAIGSAAVTAGEKPRDWSKLEAAAKEFEAAMINAWWQSMQESFHDGSEDKLTGDSSVLQDLSRQTMASAIASAGGIGFASMIVKQLKTSAAGEAQVSKDPADL
jgi:Rod binding domain-containing protein